MTTDAPKAPAVTMDGRGNGNGNGPATEEKKGGPPRALVIAGSAIAVLLALIFGVRYLSFALTHETTDDAKIDADPVTITSKISERVDQIYVETNRSVTKGELLIRLDSRDERQKLDQAIAMRDAQAAQAKAAFAGVALLRAQQTAQDRQGAGGVAQAQAAILSARAQADAAFAQIAVSDAAVKTAQAQLRAAQDGVPAAQANLRKAQADLKRVSSLVATGDVPRAQLDSARATAAGAEASYTQALANVSAAEAGLTSAQQKLSAKRSDAAAAAAGVPAQRGQLTSAQGRLQESSSPSRVTAQQATANAAQAQIETAASQVKSAQTQLSYTEIRSPVDGYVGEKDVEIGATVSPGQALMYIVPSSNVYITANYKETQLGKIRVGQSVAITVDGYKGVAFAGHVES
ncbi:MAG: HlyD family secretion protein, partial [Vulcanimicrobiaceae bacterium]